MGETLITLDHVNVRFGETLALEDISCELEGGQVTALIGPNGSGKSTLLKAVLGLIPFNGEIKLNLPRKAIGYVPQKLDLDRTIPVTVSDFVAGMTGKRKLPWSLSITQRTSISETLTRVGAQHLMNKQLGGLSGGELQRVMLALALEPMPKLLLLDEPASGMDINAEALLYDIIDKLVKEHGIGVVLVSHDLSVVSGITQHVLCINRKLVCEGGPDSIVTDDNISAVFGSGHGVYHHTHHHH